MRKLFIILYLLLLQLTITKASTGNSNANYMDGSLHGFPPYIIVVDENTALPVITDNDILSKGVEINFRVNSSRIAPNDPGYKQLKTALLNIPPKYKFCRLLVLRGSSSPEGPVENNEWLAHRRARALADSLSHYVSLPDSTIEERFIEEDYDGLYNLVKESNFKYKEQVLAEIGNTDDNAIIKERLKAIDGGKAWKLLIHNFFPKLRATRVVMVVTTEPATSPDPRTTSPEPLSVPPLSGDRNPKGEEKEDTLLLEKSSAQVRDTVTTTSSPLGFLSPDNGGTEGGSGEVALGSGEVSPDEATIFRPFLAIKSNLLYDAALAPNIEIERWFGKNNQWSVMAEWNFPWWQWHHKERVYEINEFGLELRRWLFKKPCPKEQTIYGGKTSRHRTDDPEHWWLTGHFIAIYVAGGYYDLEWRYHGEQGDIYSAGFTYGYAIRLSKHWNMEFSASVGFLHSPYTHYEAEHHDDILFAKYKKSCNYFGPTKLKMSIVWLLGRTKHKK